jgi:hypothetical protein
MKRLNDCRWSYVVSVPKKKLDNLKQFLTSVRGVVWDPCCKVYRSSMYRSNTCQLPTSVALDSAFKPYIQNLQPIPYNPAAPNKLSL